MRECKIVRAAWLLIRLSKKTIFLLSNQKFLENILELASAPVRISILEKDPLLSNIAVTDTYESWNC